MDREETPKSQKGVRNEFVQISNKIRRDGGPIQKHAFKEIGKGSKPPARQVKQLEETIRTPKPRIG